jgi:hypothetical protein
MRRIILIIITVLTMSGMLAACSVYNTPTPAATTAPGGALRPNNSPTVQVTGTPSGTVTPNVY